MLHRMTGEEIAIQKIDRLRMISVYEFTDATKAIDDGNRNMTPVNGERPFGCMAVTVFYGENEQITLSEMDTCFDRLVDRLFYLYSEDANKADIMDYLDLTRTRLNEIETELLRDGFAITSYAIKEYFQNGGIRKYTISDLFDEYLAILRKRIGINLTEKTYRKYELARDRFYEVINKSMPVTSITNSVIMDYMASLNQIFDQVTSVGYCQASG